MKLYHLFPQSCYFCLGYVYDKVAICSQCYLCLPKLTHVCIGCALSLSETVEGLWCGECLQRKYAFDRVVSQFVYTQDIARLIHSIKLSGKYIYAYQLGVALGRFILQENNNINMPQVLIPMPLHPNRLRVRGFNQASLIARGISSVLGILVLQNLCRRVIDTAAQASLSRKQRLRTMRGVFKVSMPINYIDIAIVDDVVTTGATVNALASVFKKAGVGSIQVWSCARA